MGSTGAKVMTVLFYAISLLQIIFIPFSSLCIFWAFLGFGFVLMLAACFRHSFSGEENNTLLLTSQISLSLFFVMITFCIFCFLIFFLPFISFSMFVSPFNRGLLLVEMCMKWITTTIDEFQWGGS